MKKNITIEMIDSVLPQTQCGLCSYGSCKPYAEALAAGQDAINRCPPGGLKTLTELASLLDIDPKPYLEEMTLKAKPPLKAIIREAECIGCMKCIQACPVDAIIGTGRKMHTVLTSECTGCELCLEPCPVDCIEMISSPALSEQEQRRTSDYWRERYQQRQHRLACEPNKAQEKNSVNPLLETRREAIQQAIARAKQKSFKENEQ